MKNIPCSVVVIAVFGFGWAESSQAQGFGISFSSDGRLAAGFSDQVPGAEFTLFGDATARLSFNNSALGFELGVFGLANVVDTPHETYGTFTWDFAQGGRLFLGVPRPAYDSFAVSAAETMLPGLGVSHTAATRSLATYGAMFEGYLPYGLRYEASTDVLRYAVSVDTVPNRDTTIASLGFALPMGDVTLESAIEAAWGPATNIAGKVQLKGTVGGINGGLGLYSPGTVGGPAVVELFASYDTIDKITLASVVQIPIGSSIDPTVGISADYAFSQSVGISAGLLSEAGKDIAYSAFLNWQF